MSSHSELPGDGILSYHFWEHNSPDHSCKQSVSCNAWAVCCNRPEPAAPTSPTVISLDGAVLFLAPELVLMSQGGGALQNLIKAEGQLFLSFVLTEDLKQNNSWATSVRCQKLASGTRNYFLVWCTQEEDARIYSILPNYIHVKNGHCIPDTTSEECGCTKPDLPIPSDCSTGTDIAAYYTFTCFWGYYGFDMKCSPKAHVLKA